MIEYVYSLLTSPPVISGWNYFWRFFPLWLPLITISAFWNVWIRYVRAKYIMKEGSVLLELKIPKEILKSPVAMEIIIASFSQPSVGSYLDAFLNGKVRSWFSLELVSLGGQVKFFIWAPKKFKNPIESQVYAQFPTVEVHEVSDYTLATQFSDISMWGMQLELTKADPYPIKTYIDYGLDKDPKEEFKIDPMTPLVEFLASSMGTGHNAWIQFILRAHKAEDWDSTEKKLVDKRWALGASDEVKKIREKTKSKDSLEPPRRLTKAEEDAILAIEKSVTKPGFDVTIRAVYTAPKDIFSAAVGAGITAGLRNYNSGELNGFKGINNPDVKYSFPWQDRKKKKRNKLKTNLLDSYKNRGAFYNEFKTEYFVLNTEELATIYHLPGGVATTPAFDRIGSKKSEAPSNLPL